MVKGEVYSEVFSFIDMLEPEYINKIPYDILERIIDEKDDTYVPRFNSIEEYFENNNTSKEAILIIIYLYLKFWCKNLEDLDNLKHTIIENEKQFISNANQYFKKDAKNIDIEPMKTNVGMAISTVKKENIFVKILKRIRNAFRLSK